MVIYSHRKGKQKRKEVKVMKKGMLKRTLVTMSAAALSISLIIPQFAIAEGENASGNENPPGMECMQENREKLDEKTIFIGNCSDDSEDKSQKNCIVFGFSPKRGGMHGMRPMFDVNGETDIGGTTDAGDENSDKMTDVDPPAKPDGEVPPAKLDDENSQPPEIPGGEMTPPERPDGENSQPPERPDGDRLQMPPEFDKDGEIAGKNEISILSGDEITITDSDGNVLCTQTADKDAVRVVFSADGLSEDGTYTLNINGTAAATSKLMKHNAPKDGNAPFERNTENSEAGESDIPKMGDGENFKNRKMPGRREGFAPSANETDGNGQNS